MNGAEWFIVLVEPARGGNIGASARAMKTMGFRNLRTVGRSPIDGDEARAFAHGATEILAHANEYPSLEEAVCDCDLVVGTTARRRGKRSEYLTPDQLKEFLSTAPRGNRIAIVFGPEERGLSNDELRVCDVVSTVPMRSSYPSLNLSQAVMVYTYALSPFLLPARSAKTRHVDRASVHALQHKMRRLLPYIGFDPGRSLFNRILERAATANETDANLIHSVLNAIEIHVVGAEDGSVNHESDRSG